MRILKCIAIGMAMITIGMVVFTVMFMFFMLGHIVKGILWRILFDGLGMTELISLLSYAWFLGRFFIEVRQDETYKL